MCIVILTSVSLRADDVKALSCAYLPLPLTPWVVWPAGVSVSPWPSVATTQWGAGAPGYSGGRGVGTEATGFPWCLAGVERLLATLLLLISVSLRCSFPGPVGRDGRLLEGFEVFCVHWCFWLRLLQLGVLGRTQGIQYWSPKAPRLPALFSPPFRLLMLGSYLMSRVLVVLSQRNREKHVSASSQKQKSIGYFHYCFGSMKQARVSEQLTVPAACPPCLLAWPLHHPRPRAPRALLLRLFGLAPGSSMTVCRTVVFCP